MTRNETPLRLLLVTSRPSDAADVAETLRPAGYPIERAVAPTAASFEDHLDAGPWHAAIVDAQWPALPWRVALARVRERAPAAPVLLLTDDPGAPSTRAAVEAGAFDVLPRAHLALIPGLLARATRGSPEPGAPRPGGDEPHRFFRLSADLLCVFGLDGTFLHVNPAVERTLGHRPADLIGRSCYDLIHPDDLATTREEAARLVRGETVRFFENRIRCSDGSFKRLNWRAAPTPAEGLVYAVATDVTDRKRATEALQEREERFRLMSRATADVVYDWDILGNRLWWNENFTHMFGFPPSEIGPGIEFWDALIHPDDRERVARSLTEALEGPGDGWTDEYRFRRRDGAYGHIFDRGYIMRDADGKARRMVGSMMDITERKRAERELEETRRQVAMAEKLSALGTLVAGVAHEINNPLAFMKGTAQVIEETLREALASHEGEPALRRAIEDALRNQAIVVQGMDRIGHITRSLKQVARATTGILAPADLNQLAESVLTVTASRFGSRIRVERDLRARTPVLASGNELSQVILNLVLNAADAMAGDPDGTLTVRTRDEPGSVVLEVTDTGAGIPAEDAHRIFTPFHTTKAHGTGLGLSVSYRIVADHGGRLGFTSAPGRGTTFRVELPRPEAGGAAPSDAAAT